MWGHGQLADAFKECAEKQLEGLMLKDIRSRYVPNDRKMWLKLKKDYLPEAQCEAVRTQRLSLIITDWRAL